MSRKVINVVAQKEVNKRSYIDITSLLSMLSTMNETTLYGFLTMVSLVKYRHQDSDSFAIFPSSFFILFNHFEYKDYLTAFAIDFDTRVSVSSSSDALISIKENLQDQVIGSTSLYDILMSCPQLTEEEFYNLSK